MASVILQGFEIGVDNDTFHIPIILKWYQLPQFAHDAFVQSLRRYATPIFPFLSLFTNDRNLAAVLLAAQVLTRAATFFALWELLKSCGVVAGRRVLAMAVLVVASGVYGETAVGRDDLLVDSFTHTAVAQAAALLGVAWLVRGELLKAALAAGVAFDLNIFVGVWELAPLATASLIRLVRAPRTEIRPVVAAASGFTVLAAPWALWTLAAQGSARVDFDFRAYLIDLYPYHFFIGWAPWSSRISLACTALSGLVAAALLPRNGARAALALASFAAVFLGGALLDRVVAWRFLLDLHLLRVDGLIQWMSAALVAGGAASALAGGRLAPLPGAAVAIAGLAGGLWWAALGGVILCAVGTRAASGRHRPALLAMRVPGGEAAAASIVALAAVGLAVAAGRYHGPPPSPGPMETPSDAQLAGAAPRAPEWREVTDWARTTTPRRSTFLIPLTLDFTFAQRVSWVGLKEGAAAMWAPDTYDTWRSRSRAVGALRDAAAEMAYACGNHIDYVVLDRRPGHALAGAEALAHPVFVNRWFAAFAPCAAARA